MDIRNRKDLVYKRPTVACSRIDMRITSVLAAMTMALAIAGPAAAAAAKPARATCSISIARISADTTSLDTPSNQEKLREDLFAAIPPEFKHQNEMTQVAVELASGAVAWGITNEGTLKQTLTVAMQAACETLLTNPAADAADALDAGLAAVRLPDENVSQYYFFLGSVNSLEAQGGFASNLEAEFLSRTPILAMRRLPGVPMFEPRSLYGVFDLTYAKIGAVATPQSGASAQSPPTPATNATANPFTSSTGILRMDLSAEWLPIDQYFGAAAGLGFTSRTDSKAQTAAHLSPRYFIGALFLADYGSAANKTRTTGRVLLGYAYDKFWAPDVAGDASVPNQPNRVFVDARIDLPGIFKKKSVKLSFQVFADAPTSSHGPADVRFSLLISTDLSSLLGISS